MDSFELNKIAGAVLATALGVMAISIISEAIYTPAAPAKPGFVIATNEASGGSSQAAAGGGAPAVAPIAARLQTADPKKGAEIAKKCEACHTLDKGQPNKVGPNLYGVVGTPIIRPETGFNYSQAFQDKGKTGFTWTFDNLDTFLTEPRKDIPGTAMSFAGLSKPEDRADVIAYLRTLSDNPVPLPPPPAAKAEAPAAAGGNQAAATGAPAAGAPAAGGAQGSAPTGNAGGGAAPASFVEEVKNADVNKGKQSANKCLACHSLQKGQPNKVGPNLYGVVDTPIIRPETGYDYSQAFQDKGKTGFTWTYDNLNQFLTNPQAFIPGTKMTFPGIKTEQERADVVAYLRTLSDNPAPLPAAGGTQPAAPAGGQPAAPGAAAQPPAPNSQPTPGGAGAGGATAPSGGGATAPAAPAQ
jgi:cytochrome c